MKTLKVFAQKPEFADVLQTATLVARYPAFVVVQASEAAGKALIKRYPCEDITAQYALRIGPSGSVRVPAARADYSGESHLKRGPHHYVVQFIGPIKAAWLKQVSATGARLREPYGGFAHVVWARESMLPTLQALACVRWVGHLPHASRVAPRPDKLPRQRNREGDYGVEVFDAADIERIARSARRIGFSLLATDPGARLLVVRSLAKAAEQREQVKRLAAVHGVRMIRRRVVQRTSNQVATGIMGSAYSALRPSGLKLDGAGETVAVCDTGLDTGRAADIHPDFAGRVKALRSYPVSAEWSAYVSNVGADDGVADVDTGHGTHVAGSVLGDGAESGTARIRGLAHRAQLVFQAVEQEMRWKPGAPANLRGSRYMLAGLPADMGPLFQWAYGQGARIHSNSWGGGEAGAYDDRCRQFDDFVWRHKDFCFVIAAGNDGSDQNRDGVIDLGSVCSPGTAKNCITVGACESLRPQFNAQHYGDWWPQDYPVAPLKNAPMADNPDQVVAFSSRGPTQDGRTKPDVVAPGTYILSTRSSRIAPNNSGWGAYPPNFARYMFDGGTSMATPLTAGALALLRQYLRTRRGIANPSAALLKALLVAGATRLPGTAPTGQVLDNHQGFGRVNLDSATRKTLLTLDGPALRTGEKHSIAVPVGTATKTLRIVMSYSDFPGETLINNLNLIVTAPDGQRYTGNQPTQGAHLALDVQNNTEVVAVPGARRGNWTVDVVASNVAHGPQDFALAIVLM